MAGQTGSSRVKQQPVERLGKYEIIRDIAEGTFGKVKSALLFLLGVFGPCNANVPSPVARHIITGQTVAMKFLSKDVINSSGTKTRVLREVQYMRILKHPHIVKL